MVSVVYTTYGIAMGHRPEVLAKSGGLRAAGGGQRREQDGPAAECATDETRAAMATIASVARNACSRLRSRAAQAFGLAAN